MVTLMPLVVTRIVEATCAEIVRAGSNVRVAIGPAPVGDKVLDLSQRLPADATGQGSFHVGF
jgi:hypothetical protein